MKDKEVQIRLRDLRKNRNLSQEELAEGLGISRQSIISLERGESLPSLPVLLDIVNFFEATVDEVIFCEGIQFNPQKGGENTMARELSPWSPIREVGSLHEAIDRMFEDNFVSPRLSSVQIAIPVMNIRQSEKSVIIEAELPGVKEEDLDIEIGDGILTLKGEKKHEEKIDEKDYHRREFTYGSFSRSITLPVPVKDDMAEAEIKNGVLKITLPKLEEIKPIVKKIAFKKK